MDCFDQFSLLFIIIVIKANLFSQSSLKWHWDFNSEFFS